MTGAVLQPPPPPPPPPVCDHGHDHTSRRMARGAGRLPAWLPPVAVGGLGLAACAVLAVRDPSTRGSYGVCPFLALTGYDCPGCGLMRGTNAALGGDIGDTIDHNVFWPFVIGFLLFLYGRWFVRSVGREVADIEVPRWVPVAVGAVMVSFWVLRNVGGPFEYLAANAG